MRVFVIAVVIAVASGSGNPNLRRQREEDDDDRGKRRARSVSPKLAVYEALCNDPEMYPLLVYAHMLSRGVPESDLEIGLEAMSSVLSQTRIVDWIHHALIGIATRTDVQGNIDRIEEFVQRIPGSVPRGDLNAWINTWRSWVVIPMLAGQTTCIVDPSHNFVTMSAEVKRNFICAQYQIEQQRI